MALLKASPKMWAIYLFLAFTIMTAINLMLNKVSSSIPILATGPILLLILTFILLVMLYSFAEDKSISRDELILFFGIVAVAVLIIFALKYFVPEMFSFLDNLTGGTFSVFG